MLFLINAIFLSAIFLISAIVSAAFGAMLKNNSPLPAWRFYACVVAFSFWLALLFCRVDAKEERPAEGGMDANTEPQLAVRAGWGDLPPSSPLLLILSRLRDPGTRLDLVLLLAAFRLLFSCIRVGLLLPAVVISRRLGSPPKLGPRHHLLGTDVALSKLTTGGAPTLMRKADVDFRVSRVRLGHGAVRIRA